MNNRLSFFTVILSLFFLKTLLSQKETHCARIAIPDYIIIAPTKFANGKFWIPVSDKAPTGDHVPLNEVVDIFPDKRAESSIAVMGFTNLELIVMDPEPPENHWWIRLKTGLPACFNNLQRII